MTDVNDEIIAARDRCIEQVRGLPIAGRMTALVHAVSMIIMVDMTRAKWTAAVDLAGGMMRDIVTTIDAAKPEAVSKGEVAPAADAPTHKHGHHCMHCYVWTAIDRYCRDSRQVDPTTGKPMIGAQEVLGNLTEVLAEAIASVPDRDYRRQMIHTVDSDLRKRVPEAIAAGRFMEAKKMRLS